MKWKKGDVVLLSLMAMMFVIGLCVLGDMPDHNVKLFWPVD